VVPKWAVTALNVRRPSRVLTVPKGLRSAGGGGAWATRSSHTVKIAAFSVKWNGVAILGRATEPVLTCRSLPGDLADRHVEPLCRGRHQWRSDCLYPPAKRKTRRLQYLRDHPTAGG
jgi:hypothetical protein